MEIKDKIQQLRKNKNLSQEILAEELNISRQAVAKWENGETLPDINNLIQISDIFNISLDRLLKDDNYIDNFNNNCNYKTNEVIEFLINAKKILMLEIILLNKCLLDLNHMI